MAIQEKQLHDVQGPVFDAGLVQEEKIALGGALYEVQELELKGTRSRILEALSNVVQDPYVTAKYESLYAEYPSAIASLKNLKMVYYIVQRRMLRELDNQKILRSRGKLVELDTAAYDRRFAAVSGFVRRLLSRLDPVTKAAVAKYVSMVKGDMLQASGGSSFAMKVLPEEFVLMMVEWFGALDWDGEEVVIHQKGSITDGEFCEFEDGYEINGRCSVVGNERLDGAFQMRMLNGRWYASEKIVNLICVPDATDDIVLSLHKTEHENLEQLMAAFAAGHEAYLVSNMIDHDRLVIDGVHYRFTAPAGASCHNSLDYVKVKLAEILVDEQEDQKNILLFLKDDGVKEHEKVVVETVTLKSAKVVKGGDPFASQI